jgi:hypothetical protein
MTKVAENITKNKMFWWIIAGLGAALVIYILVKLIAKYKPVKDITDDIVVNNSNLTFSLAEYNLFANQLFNAMEGAGTDEDTIIRIIKQLQTLDDWKQLVKAYGTRELTSFWITTNTGTLQSALQSELSAKYIQQINSHLATFGASI